MTLFLTQDELLELTGLEQPAAQERLLRSWGLTVLRNRANRVVLTRDALTQWQLGVRMHQEKEPKLRLRRTT
jgi:hypothetical protein